MTTQSSSTCAFCKILEDKLPSFMIKETALSYAFLALPPLTKGHTLVIPKYHAVKMHELPDKYLQDAIVVAKQIVREQGLENYNILQNNGRDAYQTVDHVHFHIIDKPSGEPGLVVQWPPHKPEAQLAVYRSELFQRRNARGKTQVPVNDGFDWTVEGL